MVDTKGTKNVESLPPVSKPRALFGAQRGDWMGAYADTFASAEARERRADALTDRGGEVEGVDR